MQKGSKLCSKPKHVALFLITATFGFLSCLFILMPHSWGFFGLRHKWAELSPTTLNKEAGSLTTAKQEEPGLLKEDLETYLKPNKAVMSETKIKIIPVLQLVGNTKRKP